MIDMDDLAARLHSHFILDAMCPTGCDHEDAPTEEHAVAIVALEYVREALLSDDAVERAAREMCAAAGENPDSNELWDEEPPWLSYTDEARAALTAALGEDEDDE